MVFVENGLEILSYTYRQKWPKNEYYFMKTSHRLWQQVEELQSALKNKVIQQIQNEQTMADMHAGGNFEFYRHFWKIFWAQRLPPLTSTAYSVARRAMWEGKIFLVWNDENPKMTQLLKLWAFLKTLHLGVC